MSLLRSCTTSLLLREVRRREQSLRVPVACAHSRRASKVFRTAMRVWRELATGNPISPA